ncbi:MAG: DNA polymerase III subunit delta [Patescibacteria group bacterium]
MIIFLYGPETYLLSSKLREIVDRYKLIHKSGLNLRFLEGNNFTFQDFRDEFQQTSMFKEKKLLILSDIFSNPDFKEGFVKSIKNFIEREDVIVITEREKILSTDKLFQKLKKLATFQEFKNLERKPLEAWVNKEFLKYGFKIQPQALKLMIENIGSDLWYFYNEIQKIVNYKKSDEEAMVTVEDVELLMKFKASVDVFKTIECIAKKDKKRALRLIKNHIEKGDSPLYLLSMIAFQFKNLLIIREAIEKNKEYYSIAKEAGLHPFVVKKTYPLAQQFSFSELKKIYLKIFEIDLNIKVGNLDGEEALELFIMQN